MSFLTAHALRTPRPHGKVLNFQTRSDSKPSEEILFGTRRSLTTGGKSGK